MSHLESLIAEFLEWQGFFVKRNTKVGPLRHGGYKMELDVVGFHPERKELVHYEPFVDAFSWTTREARYRMKFAAERKYNLKDLFAWLPKSTRVRQVAVLVVHPQGRDTIAGGSIASIDELVAEIRGNVAEREVMRRKPIPEQYPLLRTIQMSHVGYNGLV